MRFGTKLKSSVISTGILLSALSLPFVFMPFCHAQEAEKTYLITETQLTQLEENLQKLKEQNNTLQMELTQSKVQLADLQIQSKTLQMQVANLKQSLTNAQTLLTQYENSQQIKERDEAKDYAIGLGIGGDGIALTADVKSVWFVVDKDNGIIGYKVRF